MPTNYYRDAVRKRAGNMGKNSPTKEGNNAKEARIEKLRKEVEERKHSPQYTEPMYPNEKHLASAIRRRAGNLGKNPEAEAARKEREKHPGRKVPIPPKYKKRGSGGYDFGGGEMNASKV